MLFPSYLPPPLAQGRLENKVHLRSRPEKGETQAEPGTRGGTKLGVSGALARKAVGKCQLTEQFVTVVDRVPKPGMEGVMALLNVQAVTGA